MLEEQKIFVNFEHGYYQIIKFLPKMIFFQLILNVANVLNAWHGMSFNRVLDLLSYAPRRFPNLNYFEKIRIIILNENWFLLSKKFRVSHIFK